MNRGSSQINIPQQRGILGARKSLITHALSKSLFFGHNSDLFLITHDRERPYERSPELRLPELPRRRRWPSPFAATVGISRSTKRWPIAAYASAVPTITATK